MINKIWYMNDFFNVSRPMSRDFWENTFSLNFNDAQYYRTYFNVVIYNKLNDVLAISLINVIILDVAIMILIYINISTFLSENEIKVNVIQEKPRINLAVILQDSPCLQIFCFDIFINDTKNETASLYKMSHEILEEHFTSIYVMFSNSLHASVVF